MDDNKPKIGRVLSTSDTVKTIKSAVRKTDKDGNVSTVIKTAEIVTKTYRTYKIGEKTVKIPVIIARTVTGKNIVTLVRKYKNTIRKIKNIPKNIKKAAATTRKVLTTPITSATAKTALLKTAKVGGNALKTTAVVGVSTGLKTAAIGSKIGVRGVKITGQFAETFSGQNENAAAVSAAAQAVTAGNKAAKTAANAVTKTAKTTANVGTSAYKNAKLVKKHGVKKVVKYHGRALQKASVEAVKTIAQSIINKSIVPVAVAISLVVACAMTAAVPVMGVAAYLQETVGWFLSIFEKKKAENPAATKDDVISDLKTQIDKILADGKYQEEHINAVKSSFPALGTDKNISADWDNFLENGSVSQQAAETQITAKQNDVITINSPLPQNTVNDGVTAYVHIVDTSQICNDFKITSYTDFLCMAFFEKFPDDTAEITEKNIEFTDEELKKYLTNLSGFSGVSSKGFPILKDYVQISVELAQNEDVITSGKQTVITKETKENPDYTALKSQRDGAYSAYQTALAQYNNAAPQAQGGLYYGLKSAEKNYQDLVTDCDNFSPKQIEYDVETETTVDITHISYTINIKYILRLKEVSVAPDGSDEALKEKYDFAKDILTNW